MVRAASVARPDLLRTPELTARERIPRKSCLKYRWDGMGNMRTWRVTKSSTFLLPAQIVDSSVNIGLG